jgi:hypothetical protein
MAAFPLFPWTLFLFVPLAAMVTSALVFLAEVPLFSFLAVSSLFLSLPPLLA